ncbi:hypothetical protein PQR46_12360 [Paraburkholderia sediminicola]|uniref:hypothetical protein n=1 Tax=Paraburkholderia TaxID=1822464 RepID=UPI0038B8FFDC
MWLAIVIAGVELAHRIRNEPFDFAELGFKESTASAVWEAILNARLGDLPAGRSSHKPDI